MVKWMTRITIGSTIPRWSIRGGWALPGCAGAPAVVRCSWLLDAPEARLAAGLRRLLRTGRRGFVAACLRRRLLSSCFEGHALAVLARVDRGDRGDGDHELPRRSRKAHAALDGFVAHMQPARRDRTDVEDDLAVSHVLL